MLDNWYVAAMFSASGGDTGGLRSWRSQFSCENLGPTFDGCTSQWRLPSRFLDEDIVWRLDLLQGET
jgi:hypothetical protein